MVEVCKLSVDQLKQVLSDQGTGRCLLRALAMWVPFLVNRRDDTHDVLETDDVDNVHLHYGECQPASDFAGGQGGSDVFGDNMHYGGPARDGVHYGEYQPALYFQRGEGGSGGSSVSEFQSVSEYEVDEVQIPEQDSTHCDQGQSTLRKGIVHGTDCSDAHTLEIIMVSKFRVKCTKPPVLVMFLQA